MWTNIQEWLIHGTDTTRTICCIAGNSPAVLPNLEYTFYTNESNGNMFAETFWEMIDCLNCIKCLAIDMNIPVIVVTSMRDHDTYSTKKQNCDIQHPNRAHPNTSRIDSDGVQPRQNIIQHIYSYHKQALTKQPEPSLHTSFQSNAFSHNS